MSLDKITHDLVSSAPIEEVAEIQSLLSKIMPPKGKQLARSSAQLYFEENGHVVDEYILLNLAKDESSGKYYDYVRCKKFNFDKLSSRLVDFEEFKPSVEYPRYFHDLVKKLEIHGENFYPSSFHYTIIPKENCLVILTSGQKLDSENFYSGTWRGKFTVDKSNTVKWSIHIDVHYFEDGNVRLLLSKDGSESLSSDDAPDIMEVIEKKETAVIISMMSDFNKLNQNQFKRLRRLLPVTKSKINWGKAIGTYKLGSNILEN